MWNSLKTLLGLGGANFQSPREFLLSYVFKDLLNPPPIHLVVQAYYDKVWLFLWISGALLTIQLGYACISGLIKGGFKVKIRDWFIVALFYTAALPFVPAFIVSIQAVFTVLGNAIFEVMLGAQTTEQAYAMFSALSGNTGLDFLLGVVQVGGLIGLALELKLVVLSMYLSFFVLIIGIAMKFAGVIGDKIFRLGINITVYGIAGYMVLLIVWGLVAGIGRLIVGNDTTSMAFINTLAIILGFISMYAALSSVSGQLKATVSAIAEGAGSLKGRFAHEESGIESNGVETQTEESAKTHAKHTKHSESTTSGTATSTNGTSSSTTGTTADADEAPAKTGTKPRHSSVEARSLRHNSPGSVSGQETSASKPSMVTQSDPAPQSQNHSEGRKAGTSTDTRDPNTPAQTEAGSRSTANQTTTPSQGDASRPQPVRNDNRSAVEATKPPRADDKLIPAQQAPKTDTKPVPPHTPAPKPPPPAPNPNLDQGRRMSS